MKTSLNKTKRNVAATDQSPLASLVAVLTAKSKSLAKLQKAFEKCIVLAPDKGEIIDPFRLAKVLKDTKAEAMALAPETASMYGAVQEWAVTEMEKVHQNFELRLREVCDGAGLILTGHFPSYIVADMIPIQVVDSKSPQIVVDGESFPTLLIDAVFPTIRTAVEEESAREYVHKDFVNLLSRAYERTLRLEGVKPGETVPILALYREVVWLRQSAVFFGSGQKEKFTEYPLKWFARDLGRMAAESISGAEVEKRVVLAPTSFHTDGILVRQGGDAQIIGNVALT